ncbi:MAG: alpha/beta fold hydrolase [Planctomycetota bacterium]
MFPAITPLKALALAAMCLVSVPDPGILPGGPGRDPAEEQPTWTVRHVPSGDGLILECELYAPHKHRQTPVVVLFHQARSSRGEYRRIAPVLNKLGYNCLAVDLRSGDTMDGVPNLTVPRAKEAGLGTEYIDARTDIEAALRYARRSLSREKVIAIGSSYSAALLLELAASEPGLVDAVMAFSPGEYFPDKGEHWIREACARLRQPVFLTCAKKEVEGCKELLAAVPHEKKALFEPEGKGQHGARALWPACADCLDTWKALVLFLQQNAPSPVQAEENALPLPAPKTPETGTETPR